MAKKAAIIGGGPAGLTAAYQFLKDTDIEPTVYEAEDVVGGISKTVNVRGNRMDIGGHRFFSKNDRVTNWWKEVMPTQTNPSLDDILLDNQSKHFATEGHHDPQEIDRVMLVRNRVSRIFFLRKFFDYPISLKWQTFANMGLWRTLKAGCGYMWSVLFKKKEDSLENFYINRFGKPLYSMFFEDYTEKVWGVHPSKLGADWGSQRVKGLSVFAIIRDIISKPFRKKSADQKNVETSLIEEFVYPKFGPGQLWEAVAADVVKNGGRVEMNSPVKQINCEGNRVVSVEVEQNGQRITQPCDFLLSSMPIKDLIPALNGIAVPEEVKNIAQSLPYRDFITVGLLVKKLSITNKTKIKTFENRVPDTWIYIQERDVKVGRLQVFNNWSPYMVADYKNTMFIGLEYFCTEGDAMWQMSKEDFIKMAIDEMVHIDILKREDVIDATQIKVKKAYPAYFGAYYELPKVTVFLNTIENLFCIGRNGQHRYNNMDHSMLTAMEAVDNIKKNSFDKQNVWAVNTEGEYHETKK